MNTVHININNYIVECKQRKISNPLGDVILLIGATTFSGTYFLFSKYFKYFNLTIINTPGHGNTNGEGITDANEYIDFYEEVILKLIKSGYCNDSVNLVGYSLGGMTLYHLLQRQRLNKYLNKSVLLFSAYKTNPLNLDKTINKLGSMDKNGWTKIVSKNFNPIVPIPYNIIPSFILFTSNTVSLNDFLLCKSLNTLSENIIYNENLNFAHIIATNDKFFTIEDIIITKSKLNCSFLKTNEKSHFSPLNNPKKFVSLIEKFLL